MTFFPCVSVSPAHCAVEKTALILQWTNHKIPLSFSLYSSLFAINKELRRGSALFPLCSIFLPTEEPWWPVIQLGNLRGLTSLCSRHRHWLASVYGLRGSLQTMRAVFLWIQKEAVWLESNFTPTTSCNLAAPIMHGKNWGLKKQMPQA